MTPEKKLYRGSRGIEIALDLQSDISKATEVRIYWYSPSKKFGMWPGTIEGLSTVVYKTQSEDDIDEAGVWAFQAEVFIDGDRFPSEIVTRIVYESIRKAGALQ